MVAEEVEEEVEVPLPMEKLDLGSCEAGASSKAADEGKKFVVLVATGTFNPPTYMHLRMFELARDALNVEGYHVLGGYMSPVNDAYKKKGLVSSEHRIQMCYLAFECSDFVMVGPWEARQGAWQRTLNVLSRVKNGLSTNGIATGVSRQSSFACLHTIYQRAQREKPSCLSRFEVLISKTNGCINQMTRLTSYFLNGVSFSFFIASRTTGSRTSMH